MSGTNDGEIGIWNVETGENLHMIKAHEDIIAAMAFHPNGIDFGAVSVDENASVWNVTNGHKIFGLNRNGRHIQEVRLTEDGRLLTRILPENMWQS